MNWGGRPTAGTSGRAWLRYVVGGIAVAAVGLAAAGCGGGTAASTGHSDSTHSDSTHSDSTAAGGGGGVAVSEAASNPCKLVSAAQASGILGVATHSSLGSVGTYPGCTYDTGSQNVIVALSPVGYSAGIANELMHPRPVTSLGHQATCGQFAATVFTVMGAVDSGHTLEVSGPSCDVAVKFAADAYARL